MENIAIQYRFTLADRTRESFNLLLDSSTLELLNPLPTELPPWTKLLQDQCPHCPLSAEEEYCPLAAQLSVIINRFERLLSYEEIHLEVITMERVISHCTTVQRAIGSLMGLVMATSGCPHVVYFRPMARYHLPLASEEETIYRATSMYLLGQYFRKEAGLSHEMDFNGLTEIYRNIQVLNSSIARRLREATETDFAVNAVILLDLFAKAMPQVVKKSLDELRYLFWPYLKE